LWVVRGQRIEISRLQAQQQSAANQPETAAEGAGSSGQTGTESVPAEIPMVPAIESELLRLRSEVTRLSARKRELATAPAEKEQLRAQLANSSRAQIPGTPLPPGYMRKNTALNVGYGTPEDTLQTFLYALNRRDFPTLTHSLEPDAAQKLELEMLKGGRSVAEFFKDAEMLPGLSVRKREMLPDGSVEMEVEIAPEMPTEKIRLQQINGEWKMSGLF